MHCAEQVKPMCKVISAQFQRPASKHTVSHTISHISLWYFNGNPSSSFMNQRPLSHVWSQAVTSSTVLSLNIKISLICAIPAFITTLFHCPLPKERNLSVSLSQFDRSDTKTHLDNLDARRLLFWAKRFSDSDCQSGMACSSGCLCGYSDHGIDHKMFVRSICMHWMCCWGICQQLRYQT